MNLSFISDFLGISTPFFNVAQYNPEPAIINSPVPSFEISLSDFNTFTSQLASVAFPTEPFSLSCCVPTFNNKVR